MSIQPIGLYSTHTTDRSCEIVFSGSNPVKVVIRDPMIPHLTTALHRALNTWVDYPKELAELSDILNSIKQKS